MAEFSSLLRRNLSAVLNQRDTDKRRIVLRQLWAKNAILRTTEGTYFGLEQVDGYLSSVLLRFPEYQFSYRNTKDDLGGVVARTPWTLGAPGEPSALRGEDVYRVEGG